MEIKLTVIGGKTKKSHVLLKVPATIGRSHEADLTIPHSTVSRQHCRLFELDGMLRVRDMDSLNGTLVGGETITEAPLRPNDEFTVGPVTFRVDYEYGGEVTAEGPESGSSGSIDQPPGQDELELVAENVTILPDHPPALNLAPPDGQLPDFSDWEQRARETQRPAAKPAGRVPAAPPPEPKPTPPPPLPTTGPAPLPPPAQPDAPKLARSKRPSRPPSDSGLEEFFDKIR